MKRWAEWLIQIGLVLLLTKVCLATAAATQPVGESHPSGNISIPLTIAASAVLVLIQKAWDYFVGKGREDRLTINELKESTTKLCTHMDTIMAWQKEDHNDIRVIKENMSDLKVKLSDEVGKIHTTIAEMAGKEKA